MKVEQVCRFSAPGEGYTTIAKTPDLQPSQEKAMSKFFNDAMNEIFIKLGGVGKSILSCAVGESDVFLARNTLRTDVKGRMTIFTHSYVIPKDEYVRIMQEEPMTVLGVDMQAMLDNKILNPVMEAKELSSAVEAEPVEVLFEKYRLDKERYSRLLYAAYQAIIEGTSLQLVTDQAPEKNLVLVREMILCILEGLMPLLKGGVSFSTGADVEMRISVCNLSKGEPTGYLLFGVEDDAYTNVEFPDELYALAFPAFAEMTHEKRIETAGAMQTWLEQRTNIREGLSQDLICVAFLMTSDMVLSAETLLMLFRFVASSEDITEAAVNQVLTAIIQKMREGEGFKRAEYSQIATYYLSEGSEEAYQNAADEAFGAAPADVCMALAKVIFNQPETEKVFRLLKTLALRIPAGEENLDAELRGQLIRWVMAKDVEEYAAYAKDLVQFDKKEELNLRGKMISWLLAKDKPEFTACALELLGGCKKEEYLSLAMGILDSTVQQDLTDAQKAALAEALAYMTQENMPLDENYGAMLDAHCAAYTEELRDAALEYLFRVRFPAIGEKASLALLLNLEKKYPAYAGLVIKVLETGENPLLWENYRTKKLFTDGLEPGKVLKLMRDHNTFDNPMGPMEQRVLEIWMQLAREEFSELAAELGDVCLKDYSELFAARWYEGTKKLNASDELKERITAELVDLFWETVTPKMIYANKEMIDRALLVESEKHEIKMTLFAACLQVRKQGNQKSCQDFVDEITNPETKPEMREALQECAEKMFYALMKEKKDILWDLLLCRCWRVTEKDSGPDLKEFVEQCRKLDEKLEKLKEEKGKELDVTFDETASILLEDEALKKAVCKLDGKSFVLDALIEAIKPERKGLFGRKKSEPKDGEEKESKKKDKKEKKRKHKDDGDDSDLGDAILK